MDIDTVNKLPSEDFVDIFGNVIERCPIITAAVFSKGPFVRLDDLQAAFGECVDSLAESDKEELLKGLSELGGRELQTMSPESQSEQAKAGMHLLSSDEASRMTRLNKMYWERFGFPFVMCARMNDKASILRQLSESYRSERSTERARAIEEVKKICYLRLQDLVLTGAPEKN